jgi:hypothetical protein
MKKLALLSFAFFISFLANSTVRTVSNFPNIAQYSTIQSAIDASSSGDTVYVYGSSVEYAGFNIINKKITVIGPGWAPEKDSPRTVVITGQVNLVNTVEGGASGSELQGLIFNNSVSFSTNSFGGTLPVNDVVVRRCQFNYLITFNYGSVRYLFEGCVFRILVGLVQLSFNFSYSYQNFLFQNNLFFTNNSNQPLISGIQTAVGIIFDHNLFYSNNNGSGGNFPIFANSRFVTLTNNIFNQVNAGLGLSNSHFRNNITNNATLNASNATSNATPWLVNGNEDGGGNIANQNPSMVSQAAVNSGTANALSDFTIETGPANNSGLDGKDMGLLFDTNGSLNWNNSRNSRIPRIISMTINNPNVPQGGVLNVTIDARKSN